MIVGGGVIGLSLAWRIKREGLTVLVIDKGEPGREASYAAGGMIAHCDPHLPNVLRPLAFASAAMYPDFARELQEESGESSDLRDQGAYAVFSEDEQPVCAGARRLTTREIDQLEPLLNLKAPAYWLPERSVDPRALCSALVKGAKQRGVDFATGSAATEVGIKNGRAAGGENHSFDLCRRSCRQLRRCVGFSIATARAANSPRKGADGLCGSCA